MTGHTPIQLVRHGGVWLQSRALLPASVGITCLLGAALSMILAPPSWVTLLLAAAATAVLASDRRFGWLGAGMLVVLALPYGRGADVLSLRVADIPLRAPDVAIGAAVLGALAQMRGGSVRLRRAPPALFVGFALLAGAGLMALAVGIAEGHPLRDVLRDARYWLLYFAGVLALAAGMSRDAVVRGLLMGATILAAVIVIAAALPAFDGGLKAQTLAYDRGTLRMQFSNSIFLLPAIAFGAHLMTRRFSVPVAAWLLLMLTAIILSLTRMSILATALVLGLVVLGALWQGRRSLGRGPLLRLLGIGATSALAVVLGMAISLGHLQLTQPVSGPGSDHEDPIDRILGRSGQSDLETILTSRAGRLATYGEAYQIIRSDPVTGAGLGRLVPTPYAYTSARAHVIGLQPGVDNAYLTFGVKAGIPGIVAIGGLMLWPLLAAFRRSSRRLHYWLVPGWLGVGVLSLTQAFASSGYGPFGLSLLIVLLSMHRMRCGRGREGDSDSAAGQQPREAAIGR
jgi:O-antigen ligase